MQDNFGNADVVIIGAGPAGLVTARWLIAAGMNPVILEAASRPGGQWNAAGPFSATWAGMRTNTSRVMTAFSDLDHADGTPVFPRQEEMLAYLEAYADTFRLTERIRFNSRVIALAGGDGGWTVRTATDGGETEYRSPRVVIASGRHTQAFVPDIPGIESFYGFLGATHSESYAGPSRFSGADVVVAGGSISALEIATDLALGGAASVTVAMRRQRYILPKLIAGVPTDHVMFNRAAALAGEVLPPEVQAEGLKAAVLRAAGNPSQYGAPEPDGDIFAAGVSQCQGFLAAVAEGKISPRPWITGISGQSVRFDDGSETRADALIFGTGFRAAIPFLPDHIATAIGTGSSAADLYARTFLSGAADLAFVGQYDLVGPYFPVLELQARWVARVFAGKQGLPAIGEQLSAIAVQRSMPPALPMHATAIGFARLAGVEPDLARWPAMERALMFGPLSPASFRLQGPDADPDAPDRTARAAAAFGRITVPDYAPDEAGLRNALLGSGAAAA